VLPFSFIAEGVPVGRDCLIGPGATLLDGSQLDDRVRVAPGAVVGGEGFGFWRDDQGRWQRLLSAGAARLGADVELGAGSCVDRGTLAATEVGRGSKVDNLVQVGHNVSVGEDALLCAQVGLAGSVRVEDGCVLGGQVGVADHRRVGAGAQLAAQAGVASDVPPGARVGGTPAIDERRWLRASVLFSRLAELNKEVRELRREVERLKKEVGGC
jgi:UDP-3-O-[3-hydroxymyristoyl] glucosamine N-acyltransferase